LAYELLMARGRPGRAYNVCTGRAWRIRDLLDELVHLSGVRVELKIDPERLRPNDSSIVQGDASRIRADVGWRPTRSVEETLRDTLDWWRTGLRRSAASGQVSRGPAR
jgi:GDP-4-dehydro-6-deoxy-D-mannose reductase